MFPPVRATFCCLLAEHSQPSHRRWRSPLSSVCKLHGSAIRLCTCSLDQACAATFNGCDGDSRSVLVHTLTSSDAAFGLQQES